MEQLDDFVAVETTGDILLLLGAAVFAAAVCEEFLFRGLLLQLLRRRSGWLVAIVSSALLFAIFHLNPVVLAPVGLVGAYLAVLVWRSGSLYPAILAHALNNGLALFASQVFAAEEQAYAQHVMGTLGLAGTVFVVMLVIYLRKPRLRTRGRLHHVKFIARRLRAVEHASGAVLSGCRSRRDQVHPGVRRSRRLRGG